MIPFNMSMFQVSTGRGEVEESKRLDIFWLVTVTDKAATIYKY